MVMGAVIPGAAIAPGLQETSQFESDAEQSIGTSASVVIAATGTFSAGDLWFDVPSAWVATTTLYVFGVVGTAKVALAEVDLASIPTTVASGRAKGIAVSLRGRPCEAFEVRAKFSDGPAAGGIFFLQAWLDVGVAPSTALGHRAANVTRAFGAGTPIVTCNAEDDTSIAYLWRDTTPLRLELHRVVVSYFGNSSVGSIRIFGSPITAEASPPGGTKLDGFEALDGSGNLSLIALTHGANSPTRGNGVMSWTVPGTAQGILEWSARTSGGPITIQPDSGFELWAETTEELDPSMNFTVSFFWTETRESA